MRRYSVPKGRRVIWKEGMFLQPQHFQQADRFIEGTMAAGWQYQNPFFHGISDCAVDSAALPTAFSCLTSCSGIFPGWNLFSIPHGG